MQRAYLNSKAIKFDEILVDEHPEEAEKMITISGQMGVPFSVIDHEDGTRVTILGFDQKKLEAELGLA